MFAIFPEIVQLAQKGDLETLACLVRKYFGARTTYSPRLDVEALLTQMGISVQREKGPGAGRIRAFDQRGQYSVVLSLNVNMQDSGEKNFTLAHLLGYFLLAIQPLMARAELSSELYQLEGEVYDFSLAEGSAQGMQKNSARHHAADLFAMALLLPQGMVKKAHRRFNGADGPTAAFFKVSPRLLKQRLEHLKLSTKHAEAVAKPERTASESQRMNPKPERPGAKPAPSSLERAQKSLVSLSYRREESRSSSAEEAPRSPHPSQASLNLPPASSAASPQPSANPPNAAPGQGLQRLRELARKIDRSVDV